MAQMPIELSILVACVALFFVHILAEAIAGNLQYSTKDLVGGRDDLPPYSPMMGRAKRATQNMLEAMIMFAPLVLVAHVTDNFNDLTAKAAAVFLIARLAYAPAYWFAIPWVRSLVWFVGVIATIVVFFQVLPFTGAS